MESTDGPLSGAPAIVAALRRQVGYLRIALEAPPDEGWMSSAELIGDGDLLAASLHATGAGRGAPDDQVAASLWFQAYAFRAALPVVAPYALGLPGLSADPAATYIRIARNRPADVAVGAHQVIHRTPDQAAADLLGGHLEPIADAVRSAVQIGGRLLWGNAAASCATVFRALEGAEGAGDAERRAVRERGEAFADAARPWLDGLGRYEVVSAAGRQGWYWTRTNCCLWERCEGGSRCDDCSLTAPAEMQEARRRVLAAAAGEVVS